MGFEQIIEIFEEKLLQIDLMDGVTLKNAVQGIRLCNQTLKELKEELERTGFKSIELEVLFFKEQKVIPLSKLVFFNEVRRCELLKPKVGAEQQLVFFEGQIKRVNRFFSEHLHFINYMESGHKHFDQEFFTRNKRDISYYALPDAYYLDATFFSSHDMLWARINGMNQYADFLKDRMRFITAHVDGYTSNSKGLVWTASKTALTELIYGLHSSAVFNNGKQDISTITKAFEQFFNIRLDNIYKTYSEIKIRKGGHAVFLEELKYHYLQKIKDDDGI